MAGKLKNDLTGNTYDNWIVLEYIGKGKYTCKCTKCGISREIDGYFLKNNEVPKCTCVTGKSSKGRIDLTGKKFGYWEVIEYSGDSKWKCSCTCGCNTVRDVNGSDLRNGKSTGCGRHSNRKIDDLTGKRFGDWLVLSKGPTGEHGETQWFCECQCDNKTKKLVTAYSLKSGNSKSCGHDTTGFRDLTGKVFGLWKVLRRSNVQLSGNSTDWVCECQCENKTIRILSSNILRSGASKSCGCSTDKIRMNTIRNEYGVNYAAQIGTTQTAEQLNYTLNRDNFVTMINNMTQRLGRKPSTKEIGINIGSDRSCAMRFIHKYGVENIVDIGGHNVSSQEKEINELFPCSVIGNRSLLSGNELDLYYPNCRTAIEFNGNYWHSELKKDVDYHQKKSLLGMKSGIRIIHIFEYEWDNHYVKHKLIDYLKYQLNPDLMQDIDVKSIKIESVSKEYMHNYIEVTYISKYQSCENNYILSIDNKVVGCFSIVIKDKSAEIINLNIDNRVRHKKIILKVICYVENNIKDIDDIRVTLNIDKCNIMDYIDNEMHISEVTPPDYKWVGYDKDKILTDNEVNDKNKILSTYSYLGNTEEEIMHNLGYLRVYDCGKIKLKRDVKIIKKEV